MQNSETPPTNQSIFTESSKRPWSSWVMRLLSVAAFCVMLYLFWPLVGELRNAANLFLTIRWDWVFLAIAIQFASYGFLTGLNFILLRPFQGRISFLRLMALLPAMAFIEVAVPSAGLSGVVLRAHLLGRSGYSAEASMVTLFLESVYLAMVMIVVSLSGVWYLLNAGTLKAAQLIFAGILTVIVIVGGVLVYRVGSDRERGRALGASLLNRWNRLMAGFGRSPRSTDELLARLDQIYSGLDHLNQTPVMYFLFFAAGRVALDVASLWLCFKAFDYVISPGVLLTGFGLILIFSGLAALPGGLGFADVSLAVIYARLGTPGAVAVAAALSYRLIAFWLLRFIGFVTWQILETQKN
jgi:uncharacterized protein (TIRG00374 family)